MYLYAVAGSKTAKIMALFTLLAVIISLLPASAFAEEIPTEPEVPADTQVTDPADTATGTPAVVEETAPATEEVAADSEEVVVTEEETAPVAKMAAAIVVADNGEDEPRQCLEANLLTNGSFEEPEVDGQWSIFSSVLGWLSSASELEIWRNFNGNGADTAADGMQNAELDGNTPTTISQNITVVPGNKYQVSFAFSPRVGRDISDNAVKVKWDGVNQGTVSADGTSNSGNVWTNHTFTVTADDASALVELEDISSATSYGTLIDDVEVCLVERKQIEKESETIVITENTTDTENTIGKWMFNRDITTATPFEFNTNEASIGTGALNVLPIGANASDKFIGEYFSQMKIADLLSFSYDFKIGAEGEDTDEEQFYMNVYANYGTSSPTKFYDCRYNVVPTVGSVAGFTTVTFDPTQAYPVTTRGGATPSPFPCPAVPADMNLQSPDSTFRVFALNMGDTSVSDTGLDGYFDKVVLDTPTKVTTFDFEPKKISEDKVISGCKFNDANANGIKDEGEVNLAGWEIVLMQGDSEPRYATTSANGCYSFVVDNGSYQVSETQQKGWEQTATIGNGADGDTCYITVSDPIAEARMVDTYTCDFGNHQIEINECVYSENLLANGSFETPLVDPESDGWDIFDSVVGGLAWVVTWLNPAAEAPATPKLELHDGRPASDGNQYAELDSNYTQPGAPQILGDARVEISQTVPTVIGEEYTFTFDFSAIPGRRGGPGNNKVNVLVNDVVVDTQSADGRLATSTNWTTHSYTFTATTTSTKVALADAGRANTFGTFVDNVSLAGCVPEDDGGDNDGGDNDTPNRGGNGGGTRIKRAPAGEVLGASVSTPTGQVLGDATSTLPVGAPNTGAGGASSVVVQLPTIVAVLPKSEKIK